MLLDDVMSELDPDRRALLAADARRRGPERHHDDRPRARARAPTAPAVVRLAVADGAVAAGRGGGMSRRAPAPAGDRASRRSPGASRRRRCSATSSACGSRRRARRSRARPRRCPSAAGRVTLECSSAVWMAEIDLMGPGLVAQLNALLGAERVTGGALRRDDGPPRARPRAGREGGGASTVAPRRCRRGRGGGCAGLQKPFCRNFVTLGERGYVTACAIIVRARRTRPRPV